MTERHTIPASLPGMTLEEIAPQGLQRVPLRPWWPSR